VAFHGMLCCTSIAFLSRPESVVICTTDDGDFVRVAKEGETKEKRRRKNFVIEK
jgi:hypothetical protein